MYKPSTLSDISGLHLSILGRAVLLSKSPGTHGGSRCQYTGICPYFSAIQLPFNDQVISQLYLAFCGLLSFQSASSSVFTLLLSGVFPSEPSDRITVSKVFAVLFNFCGVVLVR